MTNQKLIENKLELFCDLMEKRIFLIKDMCPQKIAELCNCTLSLLNEAIAEQLGFSIRQIMALYKIQYARELLSIGIRYEIVYKHSGFNSQKELEKAMECIVN